MDRRAFLSAAAGAFAAPRAVVAQPGESVRRIGHISSGPWRETWPVFVEALSRLGWVEGKNITFERREHIIPSSGGAWADSIRPLVEELIRARVEVIVLVGGGRAQVVQKFTTAIPIVTLEAGELVASGIVASLARPGANITGVQGYIPELQGKQLQLLKEIVPGLARVAVLRRGSWHPGILSAYQQASDSAARTVGLKLRYVMYASADALPGVFAGMAKEQETAMVVWSDPGILLHQQQIVDLAIRHRLPMVSPGISWVKAGALLGYTGRTDDLYRQAAGHVDRILRGAKPQDLPIGQPTTFELSLNLGTAKTLGLKIPPSLLARADQVIE